MHKQEQHIDKDSQSTVLVDARIRSAFTIYITRTVLVRMKSSCIYINHMDSRLFHLDNCCLFFLALFFIRIFFSYVCIARSHDSIVLRCYSLAQICLGGF